MIKAKIALIDIVDSRDRSDRENLGLASIASFLRDKSIHVDVFSFVANEINFNNENPIIFQYDFFGFSMMNPSLANYIFSFAENIKKFYKDSLTFTGGPLPTAACEEILNDCPFLDFIILGYGEIPLYNVIRNVDKGISYENVKSIYTRTSNIIQVNAFNDMTQMPWPSRDFLAISIKEGNPTARIISAYGCFGSCSFCSINQYANALKLNRRDMHDVFNEMQSIHEKYGVRTFLINDASFEDPPGILGIEKLHLFNQLLKNNSVKFAIRCSMRAETFSINNLNLLKEMKDAGITQVFIGIEAGNNSDLQVYNKRATVADNSQTLHIFDKSGIDVLRGFIMLNPYSTIQTVTENFNFLKLHNEYNIFLFINKLDVYYKSALHKKLHKDGLLTDKFSYNTPWEYTFIDQQIQALDNFLLDFRNNSIIHKCGSKVFLLTCTLNSLRAIYEEAEELFLDLKQLRVDLSNCLCNYFSLIFVDRNFQKAEECKNDFIIKINSFNERIDNLSIKLIYDKRFRDFFFQFD